MNWSSDTRKVCGVVSGMGQDLEVESTYLFSVGSRVEVLSSFDTQVAHVSYIKYLL
jgi:phage shock protein PspC (stress-responsive transcriptional regulator)